MKKNWGDQAMMIFIYLFLITLAFLTFYPFWNSLVISFNSGRDTVTGGITFWPREFTLENYQIVFQDQRLMNAFFISVLRTVIGTFSSIMLTAMAAYGMSKRELMGRKFITIFFILTMFFSGGLIPTFLVVRSLGLMDSFWVMIIPGLISVWNMIIFRTFFQQLPKGLEDSAKIDGCGYWGTFSESFCRYQVQSLPLCRYLPPLGIGMIGLCQASTLLQIISFPCRPFCNES